jgi:hypothetical protein
MKTQGYEFFWPIIFLKNLFINKQISLSSDWRRPEKNKIDFYTNRVLVVGPPPNWGLSNGTTTFKFAQGLEFNSPVIWEAIICEFFFGRKVVHLENSFHMEA